MKPPKILLVLYEIFFAPHCDSLIDEKDGVIIVSRRKGDASYEIVKRYE
jgi:hypothetical protein